MHKLIFAKANGLDERLNQTLQRMLVKYLNSDHKDVWDEFLDTCIFAYNTSRYYIHFWAWQWPFLCTMLYIAG